MRQQVGLKIKALLFTQGLIRANDDSVLGKRWLSKKLEEVKQCDYPMGYYDTLDHYAKQWLSMTDQLSVLKKDLLGMQSEKDLARIDLYKSVPGIGEISALKLKNELGDMRQFSNEKKLFSYLGLTPVEYSSGDQVRQGHISRQGRSLLRHIFVESAWVAIKVDNDLMTIYQRISKKRGKKRAIVGIARRLAGRLRSCLQQGVMYEIKNFQSSNHDECVKLCVTS